MTGIHAGVELRDMYTHLLPQVDDGAICNEEARGIILKLRNLGFQGAYCTPHIAKMYPQNTKAFLEERFEEFTRWLDQYPEMEQFDLRLAALYMLDDSFLNTLEREDELLAYEQRRVLVEFNILALDKNWRQMLSELKRRNYTPVLAHPEKYINTFACDQLDELYDEGVEFQLNLFSLLSIYGGEVKSRAIHLLKKGRYNDFGTGCHRDSQLQKLRLTKLSKLLEKN